MSSVMMRTAPFNFRRPINDVCSIQTTSEAQAEAENIVKAFRAASRHPAIIAITQSERWQVTLRRGEWASLNSTPRVFFRLAPCMDLSVIIPIPDSLADDG